jgi:preprotein translocase subunit SecY
MVSQRFKWRQTPEADNQMLEKFLNIFRIPDLRKRVLFTLGILAVYRLGSHIPTPGVNAHQLELLFNQQSGSALGLMDLFGGGNLRRMTIFALGIMPYITASIIFQLLTVVYEPLARIQKEGELGRRKITQWTRYMTVISGRSAVDRHRGHSHQAGPGAAIRASASA